MSSSKEQQLWNACTSGDLELVQRLVTNPSVNINWGDPEYDRTSFYRACYYGHLSVVEFLLQHSKVDMNKSQSEGATPFYVACQQSHKEVISLLLKDMRIESMWTSQRRMESRLFYSACEKGHLEVVSLLLANMRIDVNAPQNEGATPFLHCLP